jgi:hypothetical protein
MYPPDPFDPDTLRLVQPERKADQTAPPKLPRPRKGEAYLGGSIPMSWIQQAVRLPGKTWTVASALWFTGIRSRGKSAVVRLTLKTRRRFGLTRQAVYRALAHLERAGLVRVGRAAGRRPVVTILPAPGEGD